MKLRSPTIVVSLLISAFCSYAQVQLFEREQSGVITGLGVLADSDIQRASLALAYTIEGRATLGLKGFYPLAENTFDSDPLYKDQALTSYAVNPYIQFEIMEPDKVFPLGASINVGYFYNKVYHNNSNGFLTRKFEQNHFSGGPEISGRFYIGELAMLVPSVGYDFVYYQDERRHESPMVPNFAGGIINADDNKGFRHVVNGKLSYAHMFNEVSGIVADPGISISFDNNGVTASGYLIVGIIIKIQ